MTHSVLERRRHERQTLVELVVRWASATAGTLRARTVGSTPKTGARVAVSMSARTLADYERAALAWTGEVAGRCRRAGAAYVCLLADDDLEAHLLGAWRTSGVLR